jgi:hypothetical protein
MIFIMCSSGCGWTCVSFVARDISREDLRVYRELSFSLSFLRPKCIFVALFVASDLYGMVLRGRAIA